MSYSVICSYAFAVMHGQLAPLKFTDHYVFRIADDTENMSNWTPVAFSNDRMQVSFAEFARSNSFLTDT